MSASWKKYGGTLQKEIARNLTTYSITADILTLRDGYHGAFDLSGELYVSGLANIAGTIRGHSATIQTDITTNTLHVVSDSNLSGNLTINQQLYALDDTHFDGNVFMQSNLHLEKTLYLANSHAAYIAGTNTTGLIGINTQTPYATLDISSNYPHAFHVGTSSSNTIYSSISHNANHQGLIVYTDSSTNKLLFYSDHSANITYTNVAIPPTPDGKIEYVNGGILNIDVSDNINLLAQVVISNRGNTHYLPHVIGETATIYDTSYGTYLPDVYGADVREPVGSAVSLVANDASSITFMNIVTPNQTGISFGGGAYPIDQRRSMGTIGWRDNSAKYIPTMQIVSGTSHLRNKSAVGLNTHAPPVDNYFLGINGPTHITNGEITQSIQTDFEAYVLAVGKTQNSTKFAIVGGSPYAFSNDRYFLKFYQTNDAGENWATKYDMSGTYIETTIGSGNSIRSGYVVDASLALFGGDQRLLMYSYQGGEAWPFLDIQNGDSDSVLALYVSKRTENNTYPHRIFCGFTSYIYWFDTTMNIYNSPDGFTATDPSGSIPISDYNSTGLSAMDGNEDTLWITYNTNITKFTNILSSSPIRSPTIVHTNSSNLAYYSIYVYDQYNIIAAGENIISYSRDGGNTWHDITSFDIYYKINSIVAIDTQNAIAVCDNGHILYTKNKYSTWNRLDADQLNTSGNAARVLDPRYNLTKIAKVDINNYYISRVRTPYSISSGTGASDIFHLYIPNVFNNANNYVMDISGSTRISGDLQINDGGRLLTNNSTFYLLNDTANTIHFGEHASNIFIGGNDTNGTSSTVVANHNLTVVNDTSMNGNLIVGGNIHVQKQLIVDRDSYLQSNLWVGRNTQIDANLVVHGNARMDNNANIGGSLYVNKNYYLTGDASMNSNLYLGNNLAVNGNTNLSGILDVSGITTIRSNLDVQKNVHIDGVVYAKQTIYAADYEGPKYDESAVLPDSPDIHIGGLNIPNYPIRGIYIGNFNNHVDTSNVIYLGGPKDHIQISGNITQSGSVNMGKIINLNSDSLATDSNGAGIHIIENQTDAGYIVVSNDRKGYLFQAPGAGNTHVVKMDAFNLTVPENFTTGLVSIVNAPNVEGIEYNYALKTSIIDPSNIMLKDKSQSTENEQTVSGNVKITNHLSIGNVGTFTANCSTDIIGNISHLTGCIWQF